MTDITTAQLDIFSDRIQQKQGLASRPISVAIIIRGSACLITAVPHATAERLRKYLIIVLDSGPQPTDNAANGGSATRSRQTRLRRNNLTSENMPDLDKICWSIHSPNLRSLGSHGCSYTYDYESGVCWLLPSAKRRALEPETSWMRSHPRPMIEEKFSVEASECRIEYRECSIKHLSFAAAPLSALNPLCAIFGRGSLLFCFFWLFDKGSLLF